MIVAQCDYPPLLDLDSTSSVAGSGLSHPQKEMSLDSYSQAEFSLDSNPHVEFSLDSYPQEEFSLDFVVPETQCDDFDPDLVVADTEVQDNDTSTPIFRRDSHQRKRKSHGEVAPVGGGFSCSSLSPQLKKVMDNICPRIPWECEAQLEMKGFDEEMEGESDESWDGGGFGGREDEEKDYDRDPEFAEILGSCLDDPGKAKSKVEERVRKKRNKILHTKTGSSNPMKVHFNKFDFSNSYIWLELYNAPLEQDVTLISDTIRSWHIVGRLGGCNSMNMQLSQSPLEQRPSYDAVQGANVTPTTFYNIGDLEVQDNLARIWVDIGTSEPLLLDILINALTQISSDYVGIKQVMFGGSEFENWKESLKTEEVGYTIHKI